MKALVKKSPEKGIWLEDVPVPPCSTNDVKIKITIRLFAGLIFIYINGMNGPNAPLNSLWSLDMNSVVSWKKPDPVLPIIIREIVCREKAILPAVIVETAGQENGIYVIKLWASAFIGMGRLLNIW